MTKVLNRITIAGTVVGLVITVIGNAVLANHNGTSTAGTLLRSGGLCIACLFLVVFLLIKFGARFIQQSTVPTSSAAAPRTRENTMRTPTYSSPLRPRVSTGTLVLVILARIGAVLMMLMTLVAFVSTLWSLVQFGRFSPNISIFVSQFALSAALLTVAFILWISSEAVYRSALNYAMLIELWQHHRQLVAPPATRERVERSDTYPAEAIPDKTS